MENATPIINVVEDQVAVNSIAAALGNTQEEGSSVNNLPNEELGRMIVQVQQGNNSIPGANVPPINEEGEAIVEHGETLPPTVQNGVIDAVPTLRGRFTSRISEWRRMQDDMILQVPNIQEGA